MRRLMWPLLVLSTAGCSSQPPRAAIEGEVRFANGQPLPSGKIRFLPVGGASGAIASADISEGKYRLDSRKGPTVGQNRVEITALRNSGQKIPIPDGPPGQFQEVEKQYLPARFNVDSTLNVEIKRGQNKEDFTLDEAP